MKQVRVILTALAAGLVLQTSTWAASVTQNGSILNLTPPAAAEDVADLDAEGIGTDGFVLFNSVPAGTNLSGSPWDENLVNSAPAYVGTLTSGAITTSSGGWANYDDVTLGGLTYNTGGGVVNAGDGAENEVINFEITGTPPQSFNLGIIVDNQDGLNWGSAALRVDAGGSSSGPVSTPGDLGTDMYFFQIDNAAPGDLVQIFLTEQLDSMNAGAGGLIGGMTFDTLVIPEPASGVSAVIGAAICGLMWRRRRNRVTE